jgi:hypothetical protein
MYNKKLEENWYKWKTFHEDRAAEEMKELQTNKLRGP